MAGKFFEPARDGIALCREAQARLDAKRGAVEAAVKARLVEDKWFAIENMAEREAERAAEAAYLRSQGIYKW